MKFFLRITSLLLSFILIFCGCSSKNNTVDINNIPPFDEDAYVVINGNQPEFSEEELTVYLFEKYSPLDALGRCGVAFACVGTELMPTEERGSIGQVKPSGWQTVKYDEVDGKYLYNRCHLIGFQLTGENANTRNLITGTRYMNVEGMLPFENMIADYVKETENHVLYRVTPIFDGNDLVARGVQLEAKSIEDKGKGIRFNVYVYNNQPGIIINYSNGKSARVGEELPDNDLETEYILNTNSKKFHTTDCSGAKNISPKNKTRFKGDRDELISQGYSPCGTCNP